MIDSLRREPPNQFLSFKHKTARILAERRGQRNDSYALYEPSLDHREERLFREILWSLINTGVMVQGVDSANPNWPFLSLTEMGESFVATRNFDVYDPDGYLSGLAKTHALDSVEQRFAGQAIGALNANLPDAAAVMIGGAAEHVVDRLCDAIGASDPTVSAKTSKLQTQSAAISLAFATKYVEDRKGFLDRSVREQLSTTFAGVASMIRVSRNDAGHPTLGAVDYDHAVVLLRLFPTFRNVAYLIIDSLPLK